MDQFWNSNTYIGSFLGDGVHHSLHWGEVTHQPALPILWHRTWWIPPTPWIETISLQVGIQSSNRSTIWQLHESFNVHKSFFCLLPWHTTMIVRHITSDDRSYDISVVRRCAHRQACNQISCDKRTRPGVRMHRLDHVIWFLKLWSYQANIQKYYQHDVAVTSSTLLVHAHAIGTTEPLRAQTVTATIMDPSEFGMVHRPCSNIFMGMRSDWSSAYIVPRERFRGFLFEW